MTVFLFAWLGVFMCLLLGFRFVGCNRTPSSALLQCCKELVDNSVAACLTAHHNHGHSQNQNISEAAAAGEVYINLTQTHQCPPGTILVEVIDNGCGIDRLDSIVQFFSSSSNLRKTQVPPHPQGHKGGKKNCERRSLTKIKGQYGVGLTTCLLYSQLHTHQPLRLATKTLEHSYCSCLDVQFDTSSGEHSVQQKVLLEHSNFSSGTRISLYMPLPPTDTSLTHVIGMLDVYFDRLSVMPSCGGVLPTNTSDTTDIFSVGPKLSINFRVSTFSQSYEGSYSNTSMRSHLPADHTPGVGEENYAPQVYSTFLAERFQSLHSGTLPKPHSCHDGTNTVYRSKIFVASAEEPGVHRPRLSTTKTARNGYKSRVSKKSKKSKTLSSSSCGYPSSSEDETQDKGLKGGFVPSVSEGVEVLVSAVLLFATTTSTAGATDDGTYTDQPSQTEIAASSASECCVIDKGEGVWLEGVRGLDDSIPVEMWRYANFSPLLDEDDDALSCVCSKALRSVQWPKLFGYSLKLDQNKISSSCEKTHELMRQGDESGKETCEDDISDCWQTSQQLTHPSASNERGSNHTLAPPPPPPASTPWLLIPVLSEEIAGLRAEEKLQHQENHGFEKAGGFIAGMPSDGCLQKIVFVVNIVGTSVPYSTMKKTAIEQKPALSRTITKGLSSALRKVSEQIANARMGNGTNELPPCLDFSQDLFASKAVRQNRLMTGRYLPAIAVALAKMIQTSPSSEFHSECLRLLGLSSEFIDEELCATHLKGAILRLAGSHDHEYSTKKS